MSGYTAPTHLASGGEVGTLRQFSNMFDYYSGAGVYTYKNLGTHDTWYDSATNTLHLEYPYYTDPRNGRWVQLVYAQDIGPDEAIPYLDILVDVWRGGIGTDIYLIDFGTDYYSQSARGWVSRKGLRNITVNGNGVNVYFVNCNLGFINVENNDNYHEFPRYDGSAETELLRSAALRAGVPVICCCKIPRAVEGRKDKRPKISDLFPSCLRAADVVIFPYRESYYDGSRRDGAAEVRVVLKDGETHAFKAVFDSASVKFDTV